MSGPPQIPQQLPSAHLLDGFPRGIPGENAGSASTSSFEPPEHLVNTPSLAFTPHNPEGKVFLGVVGGQVMQRRLPDSRIERFVRGGYPIAVADDRHIITVAGSRSGKGRAALVPNLLSYPGSVLVIDPKGDLAALTADYRNHMGHEIKVLDPFGVAEVEPEFRATFNPLSILSRRSPTLVEDAGLIADALVIPGGNDPHWDESARTFIEGCILHVATGSMYEGRRDLATVRELVMRANEELETEMLSNPAAKGAVMDAADDFFGREDRERSSVLSTARRHLRFLGYEQVQSVLTDGDFHLGEMKQRPMSLYLSLPAMRMGTCSRWLRLFVNLTLAAMEAERFKPTYPVLMCLDEFAVLGPMKTIEDAAGQIAGLGCKLWPVLQDLGQLKALYKDRWETFLGNAGILQFFGNSDLTTLEWISRRLGSTMVINESQNTGTKDSITRQGSTSTGWSKSSHELLTAEEASRLFGRDDKMLRQLVIRPSFAPMVLQRAFYDKHELFAGKTKA